MASRKNRDKWEFGDFQTPQDLALKITLLLRRLGIMPDCVLEPTCGRGAFLAAAAAVFPEAERLIGIDINPHHLAEARKWLKTLPAAERISLQEGDFFKIHWSEVLGTAPKKWLILGNPPWVTNAELGLLGSDNLPEKRNFHRRLGIEAVTGKSNFDISEAMLLQYMDWLRGRIGTIAVLCKTAVAHKILAQAWQENYPIKSARLYTINAMQHFAAAVDACLFVLESAPGATSRDCARFGSLDDHQPAHQIGFHDGLLIADLASYKRQQHLYGIIDPAYTWRSGIKHDCAKVMELACTGGTLHNGLGESVELESIYLFPLLKSSDIGNGRTQARGFMLVPQRTPGEDTTTIAILAPRTWQYLQAHADLLSKRGSSIYRNRPAFSIFGVGAYSFAPWKVAISGFYKKLCFIKVGPIGQQPVVFDDTVYFLACRSEEEADFLCSLLNSQAAHEFYNSMIFWSDKRPITVDLLKRLSLKQLACDLGQGELYDRFALGSNRWRAAAGEQLSLFDLII